MSEAYEAVVFDATDDVARAVFAGITTPLHFRLLRLTPTGWVLGRTAARGDRFESTALEHVAAQISRQVEDAAAVFYDNAVGLRAATVFRRGFVESRFGEPDELWVPVHPGGEPVAGAAPISVSQLDPNLEYECVSSAVDLALVQIGVREVSAAHVKQACCYGEAQCMAER